MSPAFSLYLDLLRFGTALLVVLSHLGIKELGGDTMTAFRNIGNDAVMIFFVLSGLVIAYVVDQREHTIKDYATSRLARLWSVAVPALALTWLLDVAGAHLNAAAYQFFWYRHDTPGLRLLTALTFTNEIWFESIRPFSNGPYWSMGYEGPYYALGAALFFLHGRARWIAVGAISFFIGPKVMLLFPVWLMGVWTYRRVKAGPPPMHVAWTLFTLTLAGYFLLRGLGAVGGLLKLTRAALGEEHVHAWLGQSSEFLASYVIGALVAVHLWAASSLAPVLARSLRPFASAITWLAGTTFTLYLLHLPLLRFLRATIAYDATSRPQVLGILTLTVTLCVLVGAAVEPGKRVWRRALAGLWDRSTSAVAAGSR